MNHSDISLRAINNSFILVLDVSTVQLPSTDSETVSFFYPEPYPDAEFRCVLSITVIYE